MPAQIKWNLPWKELERLPKSRTWKETDQEPPPPNYTQVWPVNRLIGQLLLRNSQLTSCYWISAKYCQAFHEVKNVTVQLKYISCYQRQNRRLLEPLAYQPSGTNLAAKPGFSSWPPEATTLIGRLPSLIQHLSFQTSPEINVRMPSSHQGRVGIVW